MSPRNLGRARSRQSQEKILRRIKGTGGDVVAAVFDEPDLPQWKQRAARPRGIVIFFATVPCETVAMVRRRKSKSRDVTS